ncbi:MAG: cadherin-like domain-containing protein [Planctomycetaceae bacterium]|nr:cadherin-like domain-containing protein [Planctomycetaceae bacterium]
MAWLQRWRRWWHRSDRAATRRAGHRKLSVETLEARRLLATWTPLAHSAPSSIGTMLMLSDGSVMAQGGGVTKNWYKLTPDSTGSYVNGTWSAITPMGLERLYMASHVLKDGRVWLLGGEYSGPLGTANWINSGEIYDPVNNSWSAIPNHPQSSFGDVPTALLPDGRVLAGSLNTANTYIYDPVSNLWSNGPTKLGSDRSDEETWIKLPDDSILSYNIFGNVQHAQRFDPVLNQWVDSGSVPVQLETSSGKEIGPGLLLHDGRVLQIGGTNHTAIYTPGATRTDTGSWVAGPDIPNGYGANDAPAAMMPNGHVIFAVGPTPGFGPPTVLHDFDPVTNTLSPVTTVGGPGLNVNPYTTRMLMLPTGQMLYSNSGSLPYVYTPDGAPNPAWAPTISSIVNNGNGTYTLTGTQLNGLSEGASYGDDAEMSENYPLVRLRSETNVIYYARTFNWSSTGVATGSTPVTTQLKLPNGLPVGRYFASAIANGIASTEFTLDLANQAPTLDALAAVTLPEDSGLRTVSLTGITPGPGTDAGQSITITATSNNPALFANLSVSYTSPATSGILRFATVPNASGSATVTVTVQDNGGTAAGGVDVLVRSFVLNVTDVNDVPLPSADTLSPVAEDSSGFSIAASSLLTNDSAGPADESGQGLEVTAVGDAIGGNVSLFNGQISFTPSANFVGTASFSYTLTDNGTSNGVLDPQINLGTVSFVVTEVNDSPVAFDDQLSPIAKNAAFRNIPIATLLGNDSTGPNEASQHLTITAVSNPIGGMVTVVGPNVVFTPTPEFVGTASFDYTIRDDGTTNGVAAPLIDEGSAQFNIQDVSNTVNFQLSNSSIGESAGSTAIIAMLDVAPLVPLVVPFHVNGSASGSDYAVGVGTITFLAGESTAAIPVTIVNDLLDENDESIVFTLDVASDAQLGSTDTHTLTIVDNDPLPVASFALASSKRDESIGTVNVLVTLSAVSGRDVTLPFTLGGSASGTDYTIASNSVVIPAGQLTAAIPVAVVDDSLTEALETVTLSLNSTPTASLGAIVNHTLTIVDNDIVPTIQFTTLGQSVNEAVGKITVRVQMSQELTNNVVVPLTLGGTASPNDYSISTTSLVIVGGQTSASFDVVIQNDVRDELNESLMIQLDQPENAQIGAIGTHTITIVDNDPSPLVQFDSISQAVGESAGVAHVVMRLSRVSDLSVVVPFFISGSVDDSDVTVNTPLPVLTAAPITIAPGQLTAAVDITIADDAVIEATETMVFTMGNPTNGIRGALSTHTLSVLDNDSATTVKFAVDSLSMNEAGGSFPVFVTLSNVALNEVRVPLNFAGTATNGDFRASENEVRIPAGQTRGVVSIRLTDDQLDELAETIIVSLGLPSGATLGSPQTTTITIDDNDPVISFARSSDTTTDAAGTFTIIAQAMNPVVEPISIPFTIAGSASNPADYTISANQFDFALGASTAAITVTINADGVVEPTEYITLRLAPPANASLGATKQYTLFLADADTPVAAGLDLNGPALGQDFLSPAAEFAEDATPVPLVPVATVVPPGVQTLTSITVFLESAPNGTAESLAASNFGGVTATGYNPTTRSLTISGGSTSDQQAVLRSLTYQNSSQTPTAGSRFVSITAQFSGSSEMRRRKLIVTPQNDAPTITIGGSATNYVTGNTPVAIDSSLAMIDIDSTSLTSAVVSLIDAESGDVLSYTPRGGLSYRLSNNTLTISGLATVSYYAGALQQVRFATTTVGDGSRSVSITATDLSGVSGIGNASTTVFKSLTVQSPLLLAESSVVRNSVQDRLTSTQLQPVVTQALAWWESAGVGASQLTVLRETTIEIRDFNDPLLLGLGGGSKIFLDDNAAGAGWFVDDSPLTNDDLATSNQVDLLSVVMHEYAHVLGLNDDGSDHSSLMSDSLAVGRRSVSPEALHSYFASLV